MTQKHYAFIGYARRGVTIWFVAAKLHGDAKIKKIQRISTETCIILGLTQSCPWVGLTHGLGSNGSGWVDIFQFLVGCIGLIGSTIAKVLNFWKDYVDAFKARLDKIWLQQAVKFVSCIGLGWVGSKFSHL